MNRFFEGYQAEYEETEHGPNKRLVYRGEYYGFRGGPKEQKRVKTLCAVLTLLTVGLNLYDQFRPARGGMIHWMAIPSLLSLVPMMFMLIGLGNLLMAGEKWELRVLYAGYRRLWRWGLAYGSLMVLWLAMELGFVIVNPGLLGEELLYCLILAASLAAQAVQLILIRRHPAQVVRGPNIR